MCSDSNIIIVYYIIAPLYYDKHSNNIMQTFCNRVHTDKIVE